MVIVRKVPAQVQRTANWLSAELDLADQLAALGFFSSDDDVASSSSSSNDASREVRKGPKKRYGGFSSRWQPSVSAGLIRDVGRKRVGWRRQRRLNNELAVVHGDQGQTENTSTFRFDQYLEEASQMRLELVTAPPVAPLASLFRDSDALKKWQEFVELNDDEQQKQLGELFESEQRFAAVHGAGSNNNLEEPHSFRKSLAAAKRQLRKVGRPLCRQLRRLASPDLMASIENELLSRMATATSLGVNESKVGEEEAGCSTDDRTESRAVTCIWKTGTVFKGYTERITLDALCRYYGFSLVWPNELESLQEEEEPAGQEPSAKKDETDESKMEIEIYAKSWKWPSVRLANVFFLNQQQQQ